MYDRESRQRSATFLSITLGPMMATATGVATYLAYKYVGLNAGIGVSSIAIVLGIVMMVSGIRARAYADRVEYEGAPELATWKGYKRVMGGAVRGTISAFAGLLIVGLNGILLYSLLTNPPNLGTIGAPAKHHVTKHPLKPTN